MVNRDLGRARGDPCTSTAELQREATTVHLTSHENYIANMANQPFDLTIFGFNYFSLHSPQLHPELGRHDSP